jgi:DNA-binding winged helix-turn-helix (wHTH) protein/Tol biopolymer transport system component
MAESSEIYVFGPFRLDVPTRTLQRDGQPLTLTGKVFDTLLALVRHRERVVGKEELIRLVWPDAFVTDDSLTQSISTLRRVMGDDSSQPQLIATIPRRGYRFIAPLTVVDTPAGVGAAGVSPGEAPAEGTAQTPRARSNGSRTPRWIRPIVWAAVPAAVVLLVIARTMDAPRADPTTRPVRFTQTAPSGTVLASGGALSPDGRHLAFVARKIDSRKYELWVRVVETGDARAVPGTDGAFRPFWSPDSQSIGFFADGHLKRVGLGGAPPLTLASVGYRPSGGAWSPGGAIVFADRLSPLFAVAASGDGRVTTVTTLDPARKELGHGSPQFLPDGRHFLFAVESSSPEFAGTYVGTLGSNERVRLLDASAVSVTYAPPAQLLYVRDSLLVAQPFDAARLRLAGTATTLGPAVRPAPATLSAAGSDLLAFGGATTALRLTWFDRTGRQLRVVDTPVDLHNPVISSDQRRLVAENSGALWLVDLERGGQTRFATSANLAVWSPDSRHIIFTARRVAGVTDLYMRSVDRQDDERLLVRSKEMKLAGGWSRDGRYFVYVGSDPETRLDIWSLAAGDGQAPKPFLRTSSNEMHPQLSPDGRWIAYTSDETGTWEVYVQSFPTAGSKQAISVGGGAEPQWTKNGSELIYVTPDGTFNAVQMTAAGDTLRAGPPESLFHVPLAGDLTLYRNHYAVTADGSRILVDTADENTREPINVVVNWPAMINR